MHSNLPNAYDSLTEHLARYKTVWEAEVIQRYPDFERDYPEGWVNAILELGDDELWQLEAQQNFSKLGEPSLRHYFEKILSLSKLEEWPGAISRYAVGSALVYKKGAFSGIKPKKEHEIRLLIEMVFDLLQRSCVKSCVEFGGGAGYLSQFLSEYLKLRTISIDFDHLLQARGESKARRFRPEASADLSYITHHISEADSLDAVKELFDPATSLFLGLHTCGSLSPLQLQSAVALGASVVLNFPCCYYKADNFEPISAHAIGQAFRYNRTAATLASRATIPTRSAFELTRRVKSFRYALHLYLYHELGQTQFVTLGPSPSRLYGESFSTYAQVQLARLGYCSVKDEDLDRFYIQPENIQVYSRMVAANVIRSAISRLLELAIVLDRTIYLEEAGYRSAIFELFDPVVSPRNLAILGRF